MDTHVLPGTEDAFLRTGETPAQRSEEDVLRDGEAQRSEEDVLRDGEAPTQRSEEDVLRDGEPPARRQSFLANAGAVLWGASSGAGGCASELHWHHLHHKKRLVFLAIAKTSTRHTHQLLSTTAGKQNFSFYHLRPRAVLDGGYEPPAPCADAACAARGANATLALSLRG